MQKASRRIGIACRRAGGMTSVALVSFAFSVSRVAHADIASCTQAHASGQREAKAGRLTLASELFTSCGVGGDCPNEIQAECVEFFRDVQKNIPTVILSAVDEHGGDLTSVRVYSDDQLLVDGLDGRAIALDPGKHSFKFVTSDGDSVSSDVLVREGEKNRVITVRMPVHKKTATSSAPAADTARAPTSESPERESAAGRHRTLPTSFWISAGVGSAALVSFSVFALLGYGQQSTLANCSPNCARSQRDAYDSMRRDYLIADVSLGVAAVSAGVATWIFLSEPGSSPATPERRTSQRLPRLTVTPLVSPSVAGLTVAAAAF